MDQTLRELFAAADPPPRAALVALGGYGRGRLSPGSDVDLLIAHDGVGPDELASLAERMLYPLWDAGFRVGHGVRTIDESEALAAERVDARVAMLDGRLLAGDEAVWRASFEAVLAPVRADPRRFAEALLADAESRADRFGSVSALLEPDLKEGSGGLRDAVLLRRLDLALGRPLEEAGHLRRAEREAVDVADEYLERVRAALHLETGRGGDRLVLELQPSIARHMGFVDEPGLPAVDGLMRSLFEHARQVEHVTTASFDRYLRGTAQDLGLEPSPAGVVRALTEAGRSDGAIPAGLLDRIERAAVPDPVEWTTEVWDAFVELLRASAAGVRALETLDRLGLLVRYVPAWAAVRCRPQRDPYHRFSVDVHLLRALEGVNGLLFGAASEDPLAARAASAVADPDGLLLGALLHDIGKVGRGGHVAEGTAIATEALGAMRPPAETAELARFLVAEHLLLSDTATRRDLEDDELIHDVAARIGGPERLAALYLLTIGDAAATGPLAWTGWRATLVRELVAKVQRVFERGEVGPQTAVRLAERIEAIRSELAAEEPAGVDRFVRRMPSGYLLGVPLEQIVRQYPLIAPPLAAREVRTRSEAGGRAGTYAVTVVAGDRPGLLSMIAGALSLAGLSILTAQVYTTQDGAAVDLFEVQGAFEAEIGEDRWREFRSVIRRAIEGRLSLAYRVAEKRRRYPPGRHDVPVRVAVDNDASDFFTVIEVGASDRIGLLFDITRTLSELELDVSLAKVATYGERVVDAFYVRDDLGRKVDDPDRIRELERALTARLGD